MATAVDRSSLRPSTLRWVLLVALVSVTLGAGCGGRSSDSADSIALANTAASRFMGELQQSGVDCFETYGTTSAQGEPTFVVVARARISNRDADEYRTIAERAFNIAKRYGGTALNATALEVRIVPNYSSTSLSVFAQTFVLP
jgi:hypothetical protein